ncbi:MAG: DUF3526 domain-containing protein [Rhodospirillaceae bacterium]|nr:DUF3526 domain-containing protein [Rhodospirillaceae bacterium]MDD9998206.1 DUF3526 domain-containing protein [Rhodospirillaceae bacterium]
MIATLIRKEVTVLLRHRVMLIAAVAMTLLAVAAALLSVQRASDFTAERLAAESVDQAVWMGQGERNPHSAAHFSRYAFKPIPELAAFDPGSIDHAGLAVWMEAHRHNPAVFRRAEDGDDLQLLARLDPAWLLMVIGPLLLVVVLHGALASEREDGTFRQLMSTGVSRLQIGLAKLAAGMLSVVAILLPAALLVFALVWLGGGEATPDRAARVGGLVAVYFAYFLTLGLVVLGVSALSASRRSAFAIAFVLWGASVVVAPRLAGDLAATLHPHADAESVRDELQVASGAYFADQALQEQDMQRVLAEYGVDDVDQLPISWSGYRLQRGEEVSHALFEEVFADIDEQSARQARVLRMGALVSPTLAVRELSAGLAGTDRRHHRAFTEAAEQHRRVIIKQLNDDLTINGATAAFGYTAGEALWREIPPFSQSPPAFRQLAGAYTGAGLILALQLVAAMIFAAGAIAFGLSREHTR